MGRHLVHNCSMVVVEGSRLPTSYPDGAGNPRRIRPPRMSHNNDYVKLWYIHRY